MEKKLSEMTLKELWELFPIALTEHKDCWKDYYCEMEDRIRSGLSEIQIVRISHIGSTAINNIQAKDIVDILVEAARSEKLELDLWKKYEHDRDGYTNAKTAFVKKYTAA